MNQLANDWKQHYLSLPGNEEGNRNQFEYSNSMNSEKSFNERMVALVEDVDTVFLLADEDKKLTIAHSPKNFGGMRNRTENKVACFIGMGPQAMCFLLNEKQALVECEISTPTLNEMAECESKEDVEGLEVPGELAPVTFEGAATFIPAPWLIEFILNEDSLDPAELLFRVLTAAKAYDDVHGENDAAKNHAEDFQLWLYGVLTGKIPETRFYIRPDDGELKNYANARHKECIFSSLEEVEVAASNPTSATSESVLRQLSNSMTLQNETNKETNDLRKLEFERLREKDKTSKDRMKKLHHSFSNQVLMASAKLVMVEDELELRTPKEPVESCKKFYKCETAGLAEQELYEQFKALKMPEVDFAHGTVQAILSGYILYNVGGSPSNLSAFCFCEQNPVQSEGPSDGLILHLVATQGRGRTIEEINSSTKQKTEAPTTFEDLTSRVKFLAGACSILFGKGSTLVIQLTKFRQDLKDNKVALKARIVEDKLLLQRSHTPSILAVNGG